MNPLKALLPEQGQAVWLDFVARGFIADGRLKKLVDEDGLRGVTSNPSIFEKAIGDSTEYDGALKEVMDAGDARVIDLYEGCAIADIQAAADVLRPVYECRGSNSCRPKTLRRVCRCGTEKSSSSVRARRAAFGCRRSASARICWARRDCSTDADVRRRGCTVRTSRVVTPVRRFEPTR